MMQNTLFLFSRGLITKEEAIEKLGLHGYTELLVALGDVDLPLFSLPDEEIEKQANFLADILKKCKNRDWMPGYDPLLTITFFLTGQSAKSRAWELEIHKAAIGVLLVTPTNRFIMYF